MEALSDDCPICLEPLTLEPDDSEENVEKTPCDHVFHRACLREWLRSGVPGNYCPLCKTPMLGTERVQSNPEEFQELQRQIRELEARSAEATNLIRLARQANDEADRFIHEVRRMTTNLEEDQVPSNLPLSEDGARDVSRGTLPRVQDVSTVLQNITTAQAQLRNMRQNLDDLLRRMDEFSANGEDHQNENHEGDDEVEAQ